MQALIRSEFPRIFDALSILCVDGTDRAKQVIETFPSDLQCTLPFGVLIRGRMQQYACLAIAMLCADEENQALLSITEGLVDALVDLSLDDKLSDSCRANVAWAIGSLCNENGSFSNFSKHIRWLCLVGFKLCNCVTRSATLRRSTWQP